MVGILALELVKDFMSYTLGSHFSVMFQFDPLQQTTALGKHTGWGWGEGGWGGRGVEGIIKQIINIYRVTDNEPGVGGATEDSAGERTLLDLRLRGVYLWKV